LPTRALARKPYRRSSIDSSHEYIVAPAINGWSCILWRLRTTTQSLIVLENDRPVTIPIPHGQTWQGRGSCSGLTQLVKIWESLACLQSCSGSPAGRWWKPCSYRLAAQWQRSCFRWVPWCSAGVCSVVGHLWQHFCCRAMRRAFCDPPHAEHIQRG